MKPPIRATANQQKQKTKKKQWEVQHTLLKSMHLCAWFTISGLSSKNFHVLWKAWRRCARKVISGSSGELILVERSKSGRPKLQSRFPIKRSHGEAWTEVRT